MNELDEEKRIRLTLQVRHEKANIEAAVISQYYSSYSFNLGRMTRRLKMLDLQRKFVVLMV